MNTFQAARRSAFAGTQDFVSSDLTMLASHMNACERSRGRFFTLRSALETMHAIATPRLVTTAALFLMCGLSILAVA